MRHATVTTEEPDATSVKARVVALAETAHKQYPQYRDHWSGDEWRAVRFQRDVRTKMGVAFKRGDLTIARVKHGGEFDGSVFAYSWRNTIDTLVPAKSVEWL